jgi:hypothetical protein
MKESKSTPVSKVYTFAVDMVIQIFAEDELQAKNKLDKEGGYITIRTTELLDVTEIPNSKDEK